MFVAAGCLSRLVDLPWSVVYWANDQSVGCAVSGSDFFPP